jgi:Putative auto-transporter adhesin, head GIN domain
MKTRVIILVAGVYLLGCNSCLKDMLCVEGDRTVILETRRVTSFDQIENSTSFDVIYKQADTFGIKISAEQNILNYIETNVYDNRLEISKSPATICLDYNEKPIVMVSSPTLQKAINSGSGSFIADRMTGEAVSLKNSGSGDISIDLVESDDFEITLSGSGEVDVKILACLNTDISVSGSGNTSVSGSCQTSHLKLSGSGKIYAVDLVTKTASIIISGSGSAYTSIEEHLNALISGSGNIYLKGDPEIEQTISGSGRVIKFK